MTDPKPCLLSVDPAREQLTVIEYGRVWDGQPDDESWSLEDGRVMFLDHEDETVAVGVGGPHDFDVQAEGVDDLLWDGPRFNVPALGLPSASVGEIVLAVQGRYAEDEPTVDAIFFHMAVGCEDEEEALPLWRAAIEAGDLKGHFGLGYTLYALGRFQEAYGHLRLYTELTPENGWAWCWLGKAAEAIGDRDGATEAYRRAIRIENRGGFETDAPELLDALASGPGGDRDEAGR